MSAIWGHLSYTKQNKDSISGLMEEPYKRKCKIDNYRNVQLSHLYMGCGIQYITSEAQTEVLPIYDAETGFCFNADCILDNREELISLLDADVTAPDGQLMYLAYLKWGIHCLDYFRGLFSMAVYEQQTQTLYLAADQVSSRCLYYYKTDDAVCFSTLLEPIKQVYPDIPINQFYMKDFLTAPGHVPNIVPTETPYLGIYKINPGCYITITQNEVTEHSYWTPKKTAKKYRFRTAKQYGTMFRNLYTECVADALRTNGEVGISMSSGLDSASVGALAATLLRPKNKTLYTYTYVPYEPLKQDRNKNNVHDETEDVMKIVRMHPNMKPHFLNNKGANCLEFISAGLNIMEIPFKAVVNLPNLYEVYCNAKKENCRVVLTGQVGNGTVSHGYIDDVLFDDYQKGHYLRFLRYLNQYSLKIKKSRKKELKACLRYFNYTKKVYRKQGILEFTPPNPFLSKDILQNYPIPERYRQGEISLLESVPMNKAFYDDFLYKKALFTYMGELDTKLGLATGILLRDPTRDIRMLQFCSVLPYHLFAYKGTPRWLVRGNLADLLPPELLQHLMRYGVQNSDWQLRIKRDWDRVFSHLENLFNATPPKDENTCSSSLIDYEKVKEYYRSLSENIPSFNGENLNYLAYTMVAVSFLNMHC